MPPVRKAGCIVRDERGRYLLIEHEHKPYWEFPKGHLEPGETPAEAAAREVYEETGYRVANLREVGTLRYDLPQGGTAEAVLFHAEAVEHDPNHPAEETWAWKSPDEAGRLLFENLRPWIT